MIARQQAPQYAPQQILTKSSQEALALKPYHQDASKNKSE
jgi:hypothetical protein